MQTLRSFVSMRSANRTSPLCGINRLVDPVRHTAATPPMALLVMSMYVVLAAASTSPFGPAQASEEFKPSIALPGEECHIKPREKWLTSEKHAWKEICEGRTANFNSLLGEELDPTNRKDDPKWSEDRKLSRDFLRTILLYEPYRSAIPAKGTRIVGAYFPDGVDLTEAATKRPLTLKGSLFKSTSFMHRLKAASYVSVDGSRFTGEFRMNSASVAGSVFMRGGAEFDEVGMRGANIGGQLSMSGSKFTGKLHLDSISVARSVFMHDGAEFGEVDIREAKIGGQLSMSGSKFTGKLHLFSASVASDLLMYRGTEFDEVDIRGAKIGGQLSMNGSKFTGRLSLDSVSVARSVLMSAGAEFGEVDMRAAKIGGHLSMNGSKFTGGLNLNSVSVGSSLFATRAEFSKEVDIVFVDIGSNLDLRGSTIRELDLTGTKIEKELRLGSANMDDIVWKRPDQNPKLTLRNTHVGFLQDTMGTWPENLDLELEGFKYEHLGGFGVGEQELISSRDSEWFLKWLAKDESYSPQPYRHLSLVLRNTGHEGMADDILFGSRERERKELNPGQLKWWGLLALQGIIGYGYGTWNFLALLWAAVFVGIGYVVLRWKVGEVDGEKLGLWYSIDIMLPFVRLREQHYYVNLTGWPKWYFVFHTLIGYVLTFFVIAGLTGLAA